MRIEQLRLIASNEENFNRYVTELGTYPTNVAIELIGLAYNTDGDSLNDDELLELITDVLEYTNKLVKGE